MKNLWARLSQKTRNAARAGAATAGFVFVTVFGASLLGWSTEVASWASSSGAEPFPGTSVLGYGAVSAVVAAASGAVNAVVRWAQASLGRGNPPSYT